jgi:arylsulfatase
MLAGALVGVGEAVSASGAAHHLRGPMLVLLWAITVGLYASIGWAGFAILGIILGIGARAFRRREERDVALAYCIIGAMAVPAALILGRPEESPEVRVFLYLRAAAICAAVGAAAWLALRLMRLLRRRRATHPAAPRRGGACQPVLLLWPVPFLAVVTWLGMRIAFPAPPRGAPNILIVTVDALRADRLGCYGNKLGLTPNLDRFAGDAVVFEHAFASAPWTESSVSSMYTSLFPSEVGLVPEDRGGYEIHYDGGLFTPQPTLAEVLRSAGYMTAAELANPQLRRDRGFARGFIRFRNSDDYFGTTASALPRLGRYENWFMRTSVGERVAAALRQQPHYYARPKLTKSDAERLARDAAAWLDQRERPFFLWIHLMDAHVPYNSSQESPRIAAAFPHPPLKPTDQFYKDLILKRVSISGDGKRYLEALYNDGAGHADRWLGWLLARLRELRMYDDTMIIVSADHGEEFWDHGGYEHGHSMYDEVLRVPLVIKFPRSRYAGARVPGQARLLDLMPTILDVAHLPSPPGAVGSSLVPLLREAAGGRDSGELFAEAALYGKELKALRTSKYKVIFHPRSRAIEVYDVRADPKEQHNLAADPRVAVALRERLLRLARDSERRIAWWARFGEKAPPLDQRSLERLRSIGYTGG